MFAHFVFRVLALWTLAQSIILIFERKILFCFQFPCYHFYSLSLSFRTLDLGDEKKNKEKSRLKLHFFTNRVLNIRSFFSLFHFFLLSRFLFHFYRQMKKIFAILWIHTWRHFIRIILSQLVQFYWDKLVIYWKMHFMLICLGLKENFYHRQLN